MNANNAKTWFNYVPLADAGPEYKDDGSQELLSWSLDNRDGSKTEIALIGTNHTISLIRIATPNSDGSLSEDRQQVIGNLVEHVVAVLRFTYDETLDRARAGQDFISLGSFSDNDGKPNLSVKIDHHVNDEFRVNTDMIKAFFVASAGLRRILTLISDARQPVIPLPFRYLSLYKALELELRTKGRWIGLDSHLSIYESDFKQLAISKAKLKNFVHDYRDRCAHIKTGSSDTFGITGLESDDAARVRLFLPLFQKIVVDLFNARHGDKCRLGIT